MKTVLITGGSGLVGKRLSQLLINKGYLVRHLSRNPKNQGDIQVFKWDIGKGYIDPEAIQNVDIVVHLAGADIMSERWNTERKKILVSSRTEGLELIHSCLEKNDHKVKTLVSSSAQGYYEPNQNKLLTEDEPAGKGYMGQLCAAWEGSANQWKKSGVRIAINRIGLVLASNGGLLDILLKTISKGMGSYFGKGDMLYPWIHIDDLCRIMIYQMENQNVQGAFNGAAPNAVNQKEMNNAIAKQLGKKIFSFPVPVFLLRLMMGERCAVMVDSFHLSAEKIQKKGFNFKYPEIDGALSDLIKNRKWRT